MEVHSLYSVEVSNLAPYRNETSELIQTHLEAFRGSETDSEQRGCLLMLLAIELGAPAPTEDVKLLPFCYRNTPIEAN